MRRSAGMTLIEVLIVLGILGILLALAAPSLTNYVQRLRFNESVRTFSESLLRARDTATRSSVAVEVVAAGGTVTWSNAATGAQLGRSEIPNGATLDSDTTIEFSGRGLPVRQVEFVLSDANHSGSVWLLPTGAILR